MTDRTAKITACQYGLLGNPCAGAVALCLGTLVAPAGCATTGTQRLAGPSHVLSTEAATAACHRLLAQVIPGGRLLAAGHPTWVAAQQLLTPEGWRGPVGRSARNGQDVALCSYASARMTPGSAAAVFARPAWPVA